MTEQYLTIILNTDKLSQEQIDDLLKQDYVSAMAWGHLLDEVKALRKRVEQLKGLS